MTASPPRRAADRPAPRRPDGAVVYDLAAHRDEVTAAAVIVHRAAGSVESVRRRLEWLASEFDAAGCPSMARHALRIAREVEAEPVAAPASAVA